MLINGLHAQSPLFIGRKKESTEILRLLNDPDCRLLTLVGPGGIGKTRLAFQVAHQLTSDFVDGVIFVSLAPIGSTDLLPSVIANALQLSFFGAEEPRVQLMNYLRDREMLLIMDNFEHLLDGVDLISEILRDTLSVKVLTTSRERLNLQEEWRFPLDGLPYPTESATEAFDKYEAVQLFRQRARQIQPHFSLTENREAVQSICRQVEGMPLGIELAATWLQAMTCQQVAEQISRSIDFLTTSVRNIPERHRSLRAVFEQSWNLLSEKEQLVFGRLSVFRGGFELEAAEQIADASHMILASLVDKSLVRFNATVGRYDFHELLRQFTAEKLEERGDMINAANRHLFYFMNFAEAGEAHAYGNEQVIWYDRQEMEMDNLRAALTWSLQYEAFESGLRTAAALRWVWEMRGHLNEGMAWMERLLNASESTISLARVKALHRACEIARIIKFQVKALVWGEEAIKLSRKLNDTKNLAWSLSAYGFTLILHQKLDQAATVLDESLIIFRDLKEYFGLSHALRRRARIATYQANYEYGELLLEEALNHDRLIGDKNATAWELIFLGDIWARQNKPHLKIIQLYQEGIDLLQDIHDIAGVAYGLRVLGEYNRNNGNDMAALKAFNESLLLLQSLKIHKVIGVFVALARIGALLAAKEEYEQGALLLGSVYKDLIDNHVEPSHIYENDIQYIRNHLKPETFNKAWEAGKAMSISQAIDYALTSFNDSNFFKVSSSQLRANYVLTERELEITHLLSDGLNSREIAERLFLSVETIRWYLKIIYSKLGAHSRSEAIAHAKALNLIP